MPQSAQTHRCAKGAHFQRETAYVSIARAQIAHSSRQATAGISKRVVRRRGGQSTSTSSSKAAWR